METEMPIKQNKIKINATINRTIYDKAVSYAGDNFSNFVEVCIAYYVGVLDKEKGIKQKEAEESIKLKQSEEKEFAVQLIKLAATYPEFLKILSDHPELLSEVSGKPASKRRNNTNNDDDDYETEEILE